MTLQCRSLRVARFCTTAIGYTRKRRRCLCSCGSARSHLSFTMVSDTGSPQWIEPWCVLKGDSCQSDPSALVALFLARPLLLFWPSSRSPWQSRMLNDLSVKLNAESINLFHGASLANDATLARTLHGNRSACCGCQQLMLLPSKWQGT